MKSLIIALLLLGTARASTIISTSSVSGTWNLTGSPYLVQNDISVNFGSTLTINSGVVVQFVDQANFMIYGHMIANNVIFESIDTTGWSNENSTAGGWNGLHFMSINVADNSKFKNCTVKDCKYGYGFSQMYCNAFTCQRKLDIQGCKFFDNNSGSGMYTAGDVISLTTFNAADVIKFQTCQVHHNSGPFGIIRSSNYYGGQTQITKCKIHNNKKGAAIWGTYNNLLIENNEIHKNESQLDNSPIKLSVGHAAVRENLIYQNKCQHLAAIGCRSGEVLIEDNLICNNSQFDGDCGLLGGGGGIHLAYNENPAAESFDSTYYIVRNNVIANNYSDWGGGGIYVYNTRATISNNHLINNTGVQGNALLINSALSQVYAKSNLFYGISPLGVVDSLDMIYIQSADTIRFDYNYIPASYADAVLELSVFGLGDVSHNVIGTAPDMVSPTVNNSVTTFAMFSDFNINPGSPCIDKGDTTGVFPAYYDYSGNDRVYNDTVDIGAFEYYSALLLAEFSGVNETERSEALIYPNPSNGSFIVESDHTGEIKVFDIAGNLVYIGTKIETKTEVGLDVAPGIYFVQIHGSTYKLIVK